MLNDEKKYQKIISEIHELNRQNLLNENNKLESIYQTLQSFDKEVQEPIKIEKNRSLLLLNILLTLINSIAIAFILFFILSNPIGSANTNKTNDIKAVKKVAETQSTFDKIVVKDLKKYKEIKPSIRQGTLYNCENDNKTYQIPYTVDIKGKLYQDNFTFILKEDDITKKCFINRTDI